MTTNEVWRALIEDLLVNGSEVRPRDRTTKEILGYQTIIPMRAPLLTDPMRNLGYKFAVAEPAWIASGDNRVETIRPFAKHIVNFTDDGYSYFGAYGPKFVEQLSYVVDCLFKDPMSRQAVMTFWRERPGATKDVPCTVALQWMIRDGKLKCLTTMRSSDAWFGWPYDVHTFSMLSMCVLILLRNRIHEINRIVPNGNVPLYVPELGELILTSGSQHLYKSDWAAAELAIANKLAVPSIVYEPLDISEFPTVTELIDHYWALARSKSTPFRWLREIHNAPSSGPRTNVVQS